MTKEKRSLTCISKASIKCKSLTRKGKKKKHEGTQTRHKQHTDKTNSDMNNKK